MVMAIRLIFTVIALAIILAITTYPSFVKEGFNLQANWQLFAIQIFGLAMLRVFWSWPLCDRILETIVNLIQGKHVKHVVPSAPSLPSDDLYTAYVPRFPSTTYDNPHRVTKEMVGLGEYDKPYMNSLEINTVDHSKRAHPRHCEWNQLPF